MRTIPYKEYAPPPTIWFNKTPFEIESSHSQNGTRILSQTANIIVAETLIQCR